MVVVSHGSEIELEVESEVVLSSHGSVSMMLVVVEEVSQGSVSIRLPEYPRARR